MVPVGVQTVVGEVHHVLHSLEVDTYIFELVGFVGETEGEGVERSASPYR